MDLQEQIRSDPRVQAIVQQRRQGALTDAELRQLGYDVPDGYHYAFGGRAGNGTLMDDKRGFMETAAPIAAIGMGALAGAGALGAVPGIGGLSAGAAPSTAATAGAGGTTAGMAGSTTAALPSGVMTNGVLTGVGAGGPAGYAPASGGIWSTIGSQFKNDPLGTLGSIGDQLGKGASGAAQGRREDSYAQANVGRVNLDALALDQKRATLRSLLGGLQDATMSRPAGSTIPNFSINGGLRPSALSNKDALMTELSRPAPTVEMPKPGMGEKLMGGAGSVLGILGALGKLRKPPVMMDDPANGGITGNLPRGGY
jgi:hypothetical protein